MIAAITFKVKQRHNFYLLTLTFAFTLAFLFRHLNHLTLYTCYDNTSWATVASATAY